jgi:hypothetical protein
VYKSQNAESVRKKKEMRIRSKRAWRLPVSKPTVICCYCRLHWVWHTESTALSAAWSRQWGWVRHSEERGPNVNIPFISLVGSPRTQCQLLRTDSRCSFPDLIEEFRPYFMLNDGERGSAVAWGTMLQVGRSRVRFPIRSLIFLSQSFQSHYGPRVDSDSSRNEHQRSSWKV